MAQDVKPGPAKPDKKPAVSPFLLEANRIAGLFLSESNGETLSDDFPHPMTQMLYGIMDARYEFDAVREEMRAQELDRENKAGLLTVYAEEIIRMLRDAAAKKRASMQRNLSRATAQARTQQKADAKKKNRASRKQKSEEEIQAGEAASIKKMTMEDIGEEITQREEAEREQREAREQEDEEVAEEQTRHARAYQLAFELYGEAVGLTAPPDSSVKDLVRNVTKLGSAELSVRQMGVEQLLLEKQLDLAIAPLMAATRDKVISQKVVQALGKTGSFRAIPHLLTTVRECVGSKEMNTRGWAAKSVGQIVNAVNARKKGAGTARFHKYISTDKFEKSLTALCTAIQRDIQNSQMRKYYYSDGCIRWLRNLADQMTKDKQKTVKVSFVSIPMHTPTSKLLKEFCKTADEVLG